MLIQTKHHNTVIDQGNKFVIESGNFNSYLSYRIEENSIELYCAYVPEVLHGNGHAVSLILHALQFAVMNGLWVKPNCEAVRVYMKHHPEWSYIIER
jgi:predicted GNAT family acetyltransferase